MGISVGKTSPDVEILELELTRSEPADRASSHS